MRGAALLAGVLAVGAATPATGDEVTRRFGRLTIRVDTSHARPGGLFTVRFEAQVRLGELTAVFEGRRAPAYTGSDGTVALVPIPLETPPGSWTLGVQLRSRRRVQHMTLRVPVRDHAFPTRRHAVSPALTGLVASDAARGDGRRLLLAVREATPEALRRGPFRAPVGASPAPSFGSHEERDGVPVERTSDGTWGERQRALEYPVPAGTPVGAPAGGRVVLAERLTLTGGTLVIDHGEGLVSALYPLERIDFRPGDTVVAGQRIGLSALDPLGDAPRLEWALYLHGIAVDPLVVTSLEAARSP